MCVHPWPAPYAPSLTNSSCCLTNTSPSCSTQTSTTLRLHRISDQACVPHCLCSFPCCRIQHRACVARTICAATIHLKSPAVINVSGYGPSHNNHTPDLIILRDCNTKLCSRHRLMMSMMLLNKCVSLTKGYRCNV